MSLTPDRLFRSAALIALWFLVATSTLAQAATPYWLDDTFPRYSARRGVPAGRGLIGRSFVFTSVTSRPEPRYGRLTLFTFTATDLRERRPMVDVRHALTYENYYFRLTSYGAHMTGLGDEGTKGIWELFRIVGDFDGAPRERLGTIQEITGAQVDEVLALIAAAEKAELEQRQAELKSSGTGARRYVDLHDFTNGNIVEEVYAGTFGRAPSDTAVKQIYALYTAYHTVYGRKYGSEITEAKTTITTRVDLVNANTNQVVVPGNPIVEAVVRDRFLSNFETARRVSIAGFSGDYLGTMATFTRLNPGPAPVNVVDFQRDLLVRFRPYNFDNAVSAFLDQMYRTSPASVKRMEDNLDQYLAGRAPVAMPGVISGPAKYAALSNWVPKGAEAAVSVLNMSWTKPAKWADYDGGSGMAAAYDAVGTEAHIYIYPPGAVTDLLSSINWARRATGNYDAPLSSIDQVRIESFQASGMDVKVVTLDVSNILQAFVLSGGETWMVMLRAYKGEALPFKEDLVQFLRSWKRAQ